MLTPRLHGLRQHRSSIRGAVKVIACDRKQAPVIHRYCRALLTKVPAIVEQVIYHGVVTHLYLRMPNGAPVIACRQNRAETSHAPSVPGTWLHASWPAESGHIVRDETAEPRSA
jgi:hypothetical protein